MGLLWTVLFIASVMIAVWFIGHIIIETKKWLKGDE